MDERRKMHRIVYKKIVQVTLQKVPGHDELTGETYVCDASDISMGGLCLSFEIELPTGTPMRLRVMRKAPQKSFVIEGIIRWVKVAVPGQLWLTGIALSEAATKDNVDWSGFLAGLETPPAA